MEEVTLDSGAQAKELAKKIMDFNLNFAMWSKNHFENNFNINGKSKYSLTMRQYHLLMIIHSLNNCTISEIETLLSISKSSLSLTITKLAKEGYLRKECHRWKGDGRKVYLFVSNKGLEALEESSERILHIFVAFYDSLSQEKQDDLRTGIEKLSNVFLVKEESSNE